MEKKEVLKDPQINKFCVTKLCVKDGVCESCVWQSV